MDFDKVDITDPVWSIRWEESGCEVYWRTAGGHNRHTRYGGSHLSSWHRSDWHSANRYLQLPPRHCSLWRGFVPNCKSKLTVSRLGLLSRTAPLFRTEDAWSGRPYGIDSWGRRAWLNSLENLARHLNNHEARISMSCSRDYHSCQLASGQITVW